MDAIASFKEDRLQVDYGSTVVIKYLLVVPFPPFNVYSLSWPEQAPSAFNTWQCLSLLESESHRGVLEAEQATQGHASMSTGAQAVQRTFVNTISSCHMPVLSQSHTYSRGNWHILFLRGKSGTKS